MVPRIWYSTVLVMLMILDFTRSSEYHKDNWVDPDDIMNYDRASKTMYSSDKASKRQNDWVDPDSPHDSRRVNNCYNDEHARDVLDFKDKLLKCENLLNNLESKCNTKHVTVDANKECLPIKTKPPPNIRANLMKASEMIFMKRFVSILLHSSGLVGVKLETGETRQINMIVEVNDEQLVIMQEFGVDSDATTLTQLDDVLSNVLQSSTSGFFIPLGWWERLSHFFSGPDVWYEAVPCALLLVVVLMLIFQRPIRHIVATFLVLTFALGFVCTRDYLVKMEEIKQHITKEQFPDIPFNCRPIENIYDFLKIKTLAFFSDNANDCEKYYVAQMMPPTLIISPTIVFSEMLAGFVVHPMGMLGSGIANLCAGILGGLSWIYGPIVLLLVFVLIAVVLSVCGIISFGGLLRLPFWLGGFELSGQPNATTHIHATQRLQELAAPSAATTYTPPPNPVNVNIYLDRAMFSTPRETVQQLTGTNEERMLKLEQRPNERVGETENITPGITNEERTLKLEHRPNERVGETENITPGVTNEERTLKLEQRPNERVGETKNITSGVNVNLVTSVDEQNVKRTNAGALESLISLKETDVIGVEKNVTSDDVNKFSSERISKKSLDESRSCFLASIEKILDEPVSDFGGETLSETELIMNTEFITSIERILLESSLEESKEGCDLSSQETKSKDRDGCLLMSQNSESIGEDLLTSQKTVPKDPEGSGLASHQTELMFQVSNEGVSTLSRGDVDTESVREEVVIPSVEGTTAEEESLNVDVMYYAGGDTNAAQIVRKISEDSSDGSGDFVKL